MTLECPLCDWTQESEQDRYAASNQAAAPVASAALGMPADALLSIHAHQAAHRDETTLHHHLETHPPEDWLPALMQARNLAQGLVKSLEQFTDRSFGEIQRSTNPALTREIGRF